MLLFGALFILAAVIILLGQAAVRPLRWLGRILLNSAAGLLLLGLFDWLAAGMHFDGLPINLLTVLIAGFLGVPGMILLLVFRLLLE